MMLPEVSSSGEAAAEAQPPAAPAAAAVGAGGAVAAGAAAELGSSGFSEDEKGRTDDSRTSGGNRWPRQETLYLLKIRQDMDAAFRDSSLKGPLWEEVSRKLASLGFHRSAKKCKEKFENVYKYHKRIKDGRSSKSDGKTYKFFDQLEALEATTVAAAAAGHHHHSPPPQVQSVSTVVTPVDPISVAAPAVAMPAMNVNPVGRFKFSQVNSSDSGSSTSSGDEVPPPEGPGSRKRKLEEFFGRLMKQVVEKQEEMQVKFIETLERRERDRTAREEAWRMQEMAKMKREHDLLVQERSIVAARDAAVIAFLQKIADQNPAVIPQIPAMQLLQQQQQNHQSVAVAVAAPPPPPPQPTPPMQQQPQPTPPMQQQPQPKPQPQPLSQPSPPPQAQQAPPALAVVAPVVPVSVPAPAPTSLAVKSHDNGGGGDTVLQPSPSRWPKAEINALIQIRTSLDTKYQEGGPKGPLWEEVSAAMRNLGYNRNAKRCKEKWENINKYYKKVKESSKKRPEDSKTCPYFHQLDAIYREKANASSNSNNNNNNLGLSIKPESQMAPIMARPEQQWPLPSMIPEHHQYHQQQQQRQSKVNEPKGIEDHQNADLNDDDYDDDEDEDDDEEEGGNYEIVQNKTSSMAAV